MPLEIIGAGFGRTGTNSLKIALERLGFGPCHHMHEVARHPEQVALWLDAAQGRAVDWDIVFADYKSQVDWPGARYWRALADTYPQARVILTIRPAEDWYRSFAETIAPELLQDPDTDDPVALDRRRMQRMTIAEQVFGGRIRDRDHAIATYRANIAEVRDTIAPDRLLTLDLGTGWPPLCGFLGVPVPDAPYPDTNDPTEFRAGIWFRRDAANQA